MAAAPVQDQIVANKFRVLRALGQGGMGVVYQAENINTGKQVALKWLHPHLMAEPDAAERFMLEARVASRVCHPNVVDIYDACRTDGAMFLVMEYLEGESFASYLE